MTKKKPKSEHKKVGRPSIMTPTIVSKLENAFAQGFNITHACGIAEITRETYYEYLKKKPEFVDKVEWLRSKPYIKSVLGINQLINNGDPTTLRWYAERKGKEEFSLRSELTAADGKALVSSVIIRDDIVSKTK